MGCVNPPSTCCAWMAMGCAVAEPVSPTKDPAIHARMDAQRWTFFNRIPVSKFIHER
jgi:hypothetical protein